MKRILPAVCFAFAAAVAVNAQSTSPTTQQPTDRAPDQSKTSSMNQGKSVTLTGCVRQGEEANQFVLADVDANELKRATAGQAGTQTGTTAGTTTGSTPGSTTGTATGTTGGTTAGSADRMGRSDDANTVQLVDSGNVNLRQHVGHQVRVTGTLAHPGSGYGQTGTAGTGASSTPSTSDTTARTGEYGQKADKDKAKKSKHKVNVQSVQMISEKCQ